MKTIAFCIAFFALAVARGQTPSKFEESFSKPAWFDSVEAPEINTLKELDRLWHSAKRCCEDADTLLRNNRIFYKSCYNAIAAHYDDEELVVKCLWLMDIGAERDQQPELARFLVENFAHHENRVDDCANCMPGDTVARVTLELAQYESRGSHSKERSIGRIENLLDTRADEISYWVQAEIYEFLGQVYLEAGLTQERLDRYKRAYTMLNRVKEVNEPLKRRFPPVEKNYNEMLRIAELKVEKE